MHLLVLLEKEKNWSLKKLSVNELVVLFLRWCYLHVLELGLRWMLRLRVAVAQQQLTEYHISLKLNWNWSYFFLDFQNLLFFFPSNLVHSSTAFNMNFPSIQGKNAAVWIEVDNRTVQIWSYVSTEQHLWKAENSCSHFFPLVSNWVLEKKLSQKNCFEGAKGNNAQKNKLKGRKARVNGSCHNSMTPWCLQAQITEDSL